MKMKRLVLIAGMALALAGSVHASPPQSPRRQAFEKCFAQAYDQRLKELAREEKDDDCGTCEAQRSQAADDCKRFLTKEEIDCEDSAEYGVEMGNPFRCDGLSPQLCPPGTSVHGSPEAVSCVSRYGNICSAIRDRIRCEKNPECKWELAEKGGAPGTIGVWINHPAWCWKRQNCPSGTIFTGPEHGCAATR
jgi:hypothetical protein